MKFLSVVLLKWMILLSFLAGAQQNLSDEQFQNYRRQLQKKFKLNLDQLVQSEKNIIGIEVLLAKGFEDRIYSQFGHVMVRFVDNDGLWSNDMTVSFVADVNEPVLDYKKAVLGQYAATAEIKNLYEFWQEYIADEKREILRYLIPTESEDIHNMIQTLKNWQARPELSGAYTFLSNNCAHILAKFFVQSGLSYEVYIPKTPFGVPEWLEESLMNPYPPVLVLNQTNVINKLVNVLNVTEGDLKRGRDWPQNSYELIRNNFNEMEIKFIYDNFYMMPVDLSKQIARDMNYNNTSVSYAAVMSMNNLRPELYRICTDEACIDNLIKISKKIWSTEELDKKYDKLNFILRNYSIKGRQSCWDSESGDHDCTYNLIELKSKNLEWYFKNYVGRI